MKRISIWILLFIIVLPVFSQREDETDLQVRINQIAADFPDVEVYLSVFSKSTQKPITTLVHGNFSLYVDSRLINPKVKTEVFLHQDKPVSYYAAIFGSGVVAWDEDAFTAQKDGLRLLTDKIQQGKDYFSLFLITEDPKMIFQYETNKDKMQEGLAKLETEAGVSPRLYDSILKIIPSIDDEVNVIQEPVTRKVIFVISDGRDEGSIFADSFFQKITKRDVPVYAVGISVIGGGEYLDALEDISDRTGGNYKFAPSYKEIPKIIDNFHNQIMSTYVLKFRINEIKGDDQQHELKIEVNYENEKTSFYKPFLAKKRPLNIFILILIIVLSLLLVAGVVFLILIFRRKSRAQMGITRRKCPECRRRMKDDWDECLFCKYLPPKTKKGEGN